jgi:uncharacterized protein
LLVVDTSVLLAAADNADPDHLTCVAAIEGESPLVTTPLVVAESAYLIGRQLGAAAEAAFFRAVAAGEIQVEMITPADARRIAELIETYADLGLGGTDASLVALVFPCSAAWFLTSTQRLREQKQRSQERVLSLA